MNLTNVNKAVKQTAIALGTLVMPFGYSYAQQSAGKASPGDMVDALHSAFGDHHSRAVHAKGIIFEGTFTPAKDAGKLTKAFHLQKESSKVIARFSDFTGIPDIPDNAGAANPRGLGIRFIMPDGKTTDIVSHSFNGFPTATTDEFRELLLAIGHSGAGVASPTPVEQFLGTHPVAKTFLTTQHMPVSYSTTNYFGVNSFKFTNRKGESHFIRYRFVTEDGEKYLNPDEISKKDKNFLMTEIKERITKGPVKFKLYAQVAEDGDKIDNPSIAWPEARQLVLLGEITITKLSENTDEQDKALTINPGNIPDGIAIADPMLEIRRNAYPISVKERQ
ncbi:MAG: catalase family peroxidase [Bacteroidota bacterium]